ncbi:hypothetical protein LZ554_000659 [Drepanopeziza brunnea f. sp. 'monogermtubi']|nr:hypothetical protein LZ554_000659 [Drepanopeziza brunnea f. sp. 'monogermtubi']
MARSKSIFAILLALSFFFNGAQAWFWRKRIVIGYAVVSAEDAKFINEKNELYVESFLYTSSLGPGFYMVNEPREWTSLEGDWFCAVKARRWKMKRAPKAYIPKTYTKNPKKPWWNLKKVQVKHSDVAPKPIPLWGEDEIVFEEYLKKELSISKPDKALRFAWVKDLNWRMQMAIPMEEVNTNKLDLWAQCFPTEEELRKFSEEPVDWSSWKIRGDPGDWKTGLEEPAVAKPEANPQGSGCCIL